MGCDPFTSPGGGPCSLGRLSILIPNITLLHNWKQKSKSTHEKQSYSELKENCDSQVYNWNKAKQFSDISWLQLRLSVSFLTCRVGLVSRQTLPSLHSVTSLVTLRLPDMQHCKTEPPYRAFLLLGHGHGCQDFEGMCCLNISSHSESIQTSIHKLREQIKDLKVEKYPDWINELFGQWGFTGKVTYFVNGIFLIVIIVFIVLVMFPC